METERADSPSGAAPHEGIRRSAHVVVVGVGLLLVGLMQGYGPVSTIAVGALGWLKTGRYLPAGMNQVAPEVETTLSLVWLWPPILAVWLWASGSRQVVKAASLTLAAIALHALLALGTRGVGAGVASLIGPSEVWPKVRDAVTVVVAAALSLLAMRADNLPNAALSEPGQSANQRSTEKSIRLALIAAFGFGFTAVMGSAWNLFGEVISQSPTIRDLVLQAGAGMPDRVPALPQETPQEREARRLLGMALDLNNSARYGQAKVGYDQALDAYAALASSAGVDNKYRMPLALCLNNQAWLLATCPDPALREPARSVDLAERAVKFVGDEGTYWNTLGVAYFRVGRWERAIDALTHSMKLRSGGDGLDWYFLAMTHHQLGHDEEANRWFENAERWVETTRPLDAEVHRFRAEAGQALGRPVPPSPAISDRRQPFGLAPPRAAKPPGP